MILVICTSADCLSSFRVMGDVDEVQHLVGENSSFWPNKYICPKCSAPAQGALESEVDPRTLVNLRDLEAQELFQALSGMGLPEEQQCSGEFVTSLLFNQKIKTVTGHTVFGTTRYCVEWLEFENGQRMYFGASVHGALVYRLTLPPNHTEKVLKELDVTP